MSNELRSRTTLEPTLENLAKAIFVVNKHAKTAPDPKFLYELKRVALEKLIEEESAKKIGLHFSRNPKLCQQSSTVIVSCGDYLFHLPPTKEDFKTLSHFGKMNNQYRNPKTYLPLQQAKELLIVFTGLKPSNNQPKERFSLRHKSAFSRTNPWKSDFGYNRKRK